MAINIKSFKNFLVVAIAILCISATAAVKNTYILSKDYTVTIHGTSNLHSWDEKVGIVSGDGELNRNSDGSFDLNAISIKINVHSIKSDEGSVMNNKTYSALKADANPEIIFKLDVPVKSIKAGATANTISARGNLTVAGVTNPVIMQVKIVMDESGKLAFEGSQTIKMSDYNIAPPTALFGMLKTGDEITINFKTNFTIVNN